MRLKLSVSLNLASWARGLAIWLGLVWWWACSPAHALQIDVKPLKLHTGVEVSALHLSGTMVEGDGENLEAFLRQPKLFPANTLWLTLDVEGGSVREALRMARSLRQWGFVSHVPAQAKCLSACIFLYAAGLLRIPALDDKQNIVSNIGIHRAFISPKYLATLTLGDAEKMTKSIHQSIERSFAEFDLPMALYQVAMQTPSNEMHWLSAAEINSIGTYPTWFDEYVLAQCEALTTIEANKQSPAYAQQKSSCAARLIQAHRQKIKAP